MRIAMLGTRGVPANYGGFETCVEQLGARLVERGHEVTVYCRPHHIKYPGKRYRGMRLVKLPTIRNKYLDTLVHTFLSSLHALAQPYDICLYFIAGNSPVSWIPRLAGKHTILNVDGLDWQRDKWPPLAKHYIRFAERLATFLPNQIVTDSRIVRQYYRDVYRANALYIAYGSEVEPLPPGKTLEKLGLEPRKYMLFVGRLVPENRVEHLVDAFGMLSDRKGMKCVIVGDSSYAELYRDALKKRAGDDVLFTSYIFGEGYRELNANAYCFVETSAVGGTHPALLEAMAFGNCVVTNNIPESLESIGETGFSYDGTCTGSPLGQAENLRDTLQYLLDHPEVVVEQRAASLAWVRERYSWETVTDQYIELFERAMGRETRPEWGGAPEPADERFASTELQGSRQRQGATVRVPGANEYVVPPAAPQARRGAAEPVPRHPTDRMPV
jgi:glycosyltransferase involved in cell wall biosynthesis